MSKGPFCPSAAALPDTLGLFPLSAAVLLPYGRLPLNIFEPRYLNLVNDALGNQRLIGMIQPRPQPDPVLGNLYQVGCAGRISHFEETEDGRYLIALDGVSRFEWTKELDTTRGYRMVRVRWERFREDMHSPEAELPLNPQAFVEEIKSLLATQGMAVEAAGLETLAIGTLIDLLGMQLPLSPVDKQAVLESPTLASRAEILLALLKMRGSDQDAQATRH